LGGHSCFLIIWWDLPESSSNKISAGSGDRKADNWEGDNSESAVLESSAISSLVVKNCFYSSRRGDFLVDDSRGKREPLPFKYFFRRIDNLVHDSGIKGAPFLFRYFFGSFDDFLLYPTSHHVSKIKSL
jgi:hypothetical protein